MSWTDIPVLTVLDAELFAADAWPPATWWAELAGRPRRVYVVATAAEGAVVGYAGLDLGGDVADVMTVAVAPPARGTGLGDLLVTTLLDRAAKSGAQAVMLEVRADNEPALRLYERHGFDRLSIRHRYYQPGDVDAVVMRALLDRRTP
ncbi:ribosomal protein S18-alanine N-acetyltransferase [Dermatophilaceae bacterium Soc4.6]